MKSSIFVIATIFVSVVAGVFFSKKVISLENNKIVNNVVFSGGSDKSGVYLKNDINTTKVETGFVESKCFFNDVKIKSYMYHYIRPKVRQNNEFLRKTSILPETFEKQMKFLSEKQKKGEIYTSFVSEIEGFLKNKCFPSNNIFLMISDDGRDDNYYKLYKISKENNIKFNLGIISDYASEEKNVIPFATKKQIQEMLDSNIIKIISHSKTHADLSGLSKQNQKIEICDSKKNLENEFNVKIDAFVYPSGRIGKYSKDFLKECGYHYAFGVQGPGVVDVNNIFDNIHIPRYRVQEHTNYKKLFGF